jgi:hypothetical protein
VLVDEPGGWVAFFRTDVNATVAEILATFADRFSLEITFRDCKEIVGAGQGNSCDSAPRGHRGGNSSHRRAAAQPGHIRVERIAESTDPRKPRRKKIPRKRKPPRKWNLEVRPEASGAQKEHLQELFEHAKSQ